MRFCHTHLATVNVALVLAQKFLNQHLPQPKILRLSFQTKFTDCGFTQRRHDTQHNDTKNNNTKQNNNLKDTQHNDTKNNDTEQKQSTK